jgi:hypothetical protein
MRPLLASRITAVTVIKAGWEITATLLTGWL